MIRGTSAAPLSQLLAILEPVLRKTAGLGSWQVISPTASAVTGSLVAVPSLLQVQNERYTQPTVLLLDHVEGDAEIPDVSMQGRTV